MKYFIIGAALMLASIFVMAFVSKTLAFIVFGIGVCFQVYQIWGFLKEHRQMSLGLKRDRAKWQG